MSQGEKKRKEKKIYVYYIYSYRVMRTELKLRVLCNCKMKDDIYVANIISSATAVNECTTTGGVVETM